MECSGDEGEAAEVEGEIADIEGELIASQEGQLQLGTVERIERIGNAYVAWAHEHKFVVASHVTLGRYIQYLTKQKNFAPTTRSFRCFLARPG